MVKIYCLQKEELCLQFFFVLGSQQVLITKVNSHVMLFNFQYILKNSFTLYLSDFQLNSLLLKYNQVNKITVQKNYRSKCDGFHCSGLDCGRLRYDSKRACALCVVACFHSYCIKMAGGNSYHAILNCSVPRIGQPTTASAY